MTPVSPPTKGSLRGKPCRLMIFEEGVQIIKESKPEKPIEIGFRDIYTAKADRRHVSVYAVVPSKRGKESGKNNHIVYELELDTIEDASLFAAATSRLALGCRPDGEKGYTMGHAQST